MMLETLEKQKVIKGMSEEERMKLQIWNADLVPRYCDKETEVYLVEDVALVVAELRKYTKQVLLIARALEDFKLKCYERLNKDKEFDDFIMNNAPCDYNLLRIERKFDELFAGEKK